MLVKAGKKERGAGYGTSVSLAVQALHEHLVLTAIDKSGVEIPKEHPGQCTAGKLWSRLQSPIDCKPSGTQTDQGQKQKLRNLGEVFILVVHLKLPSP